MTLGATPLGANNENNEEDASRNIRRMFGEVAPRYDLLNRLLSLYIDQFWRRTLVRQTRTELKKTHTRILDLCCGTGDLLIELELERRRLHSASGFQGIGLDFSRPMLVAANRKIAKKGLSSMLIEADSLCLPHLNNQFDLITIAYGFRNLANYQKGVNEIFRVLRPGGRLALLEFSQPTNPLIRPLFSFYFHNILPRLGNAFSGSGNAYTYLQQSVDRFLTPSELCAVFKVAGFSHTESIPITGGISVLHLAVK
ncbi:MAG: bifunctional demethylmenaquinone methyltransferase/2-methoxy-6-polyprenyl-1,4-benzoquinol methylase UbiE [Solibacterales bacterium]|nr:bifunctional demethylmenaquinone methyltransferase/2-methoxy-6-polyprenyl-1,4-benzoquinol methylase UbiE [Bryobacterales bacterium]|tara:strand:+ start:1673 stop:2437 length:765 start_codon:yes stop_codon:yes gene_type:complete